MKKRVLSLLLTASMLLSLLAVFATGASASAEDANEASSGGTERSYVDLYVKDGLVALFDAYSMTASSEKLTEWRPLDLYGKAGYDDYLALSDASGAYALSADKSFEWRAGDGRLVLHRLDVAGGFDAYLNANAVASALGDTWTVQEVERQSAAPLSSYVPAIDENGTVTNLAAVSGDKVANWQSNVYGMLLSTQMFFFVKADSKLLASYLQSTSFNVNNDVSNAKWAANQQFFTPYYVKDASKPVTGLKTSGGASLDGYYVTDGTMGVVERTVSQHSRSESAGKYTLEYSMSFHHPLSSVPGGALVTAASASSVSYKVTTENAAAATAKTFILLRDCAESNYSIRVYNKVLNQGELDRNHLADLVAFYGIGMEDLSSMNEDMLSKVVTATVNIPLDDRSESARSENKAAVEKAIEDVKNAYLNAETGSKMTAHDALYIGADGEKTENGGSLLALFSAYGESNASLDLENAIWFDKVGGNHATIVGGVYGTSNTSGWRVRAGGGFGYDLTVEDNPTNAKYLKRQESSGNMIVFDPSLILSPDFTVEYVAAYPYIKLVENGSVVGDYTGKKGSHWDDFDMPIHTIGLLTTAAARAGYIDGNEYSGSNKQPYRGVRWLVAPPGMTHGTAGAAYGYNRSLWGDSNPDTLVHNRAVTRDEVALGGDVYEATYSLYKNAGMTDAATYTTLDVTQPPVANVKKNPYFKDAEGEEFKLFQKTPSTVFAVRIYDAPLTLSEMKYNRFIDLAAYCGADLGAFAKLGHEEQLLVVDVMGMNEYSFNKQLFEAGLDGIIASFNGDEEEDTILYVTDGLTTLLCAYDGYSTDYFVTGEKTLIWMNAIGDGFGTLEGTGWKKNPGGGFTVVKTTADYNGTGFMTWKERYGLTLDPTLLPKGEFTVELVANPVGLTEEDGTRHIDDHSPTGTFNENGFAIGPLRALQFSCYRVGPDGQMERRWVYGKGDTPNNDSGWKTKYSDSYWYGLEIDDIVTLEISLAISDTEHKYTIRQGDKKGGFSVALANTMTNEEADSMFRLMHGVAGTIYSVRVYDHVLSAKEVAQNRMADLIYYYGLDISLLKTVFANAGDTISLLADAFADIGFDLERTEAQRIFDERLAAIWIRQSGFGVRKDLSDGLRYYFDINEAPFAALMRAGFSVEAGAVVNVGKSGVPVLDGYGYDYKVVAFNDVMGKNLGFFTDENTFAVTVNYHASDRETLTSNVLVRGYVLLTDPDGNQTVCYTVLTDEAPKSVFEAYYCLNEQGREDVIKNAALSDFITGRIARSYRDAYVYLDAAAPAGGNGSKDKPYVCFEDAFKAAKDILRGTAAPLNLYLEAADGRYSIYETQELLASDKPNPYSTFTVTSRSGNAVLTTTVDLDTSKFTLEGDCIYSYQLAPDENGEYPSFRCLYINDTMSELALNGSYRVADETRTTYRTAYHRTMDGIYQTAKDTGAIADFDFIPEQYQGREDLIERYMLYRDTFIAYNDAYKIASATPDALAYGMAPTKANGTETYVSSFNEFVWHFIAASEVFKKAKSVTIWGSDFKNAKPTQTLEDFMGNEAAYKMYTDTFAAAKAYLIKEQKTALYTNFAPAMSTTYSIDLGKLYIPEALLGDLRPYIEAGREENKAASLALLKEAQADLLLKEEALALASAHHAVLKTVERALDELLVYQGEDTLISAINERIATLNAESVEGKALLAAYEAVLLGEDGSVRKALEHQLVRTAAEAVSYGADTLEVARTAYTAASDTLSIAQSRYQDAHDEDRWVRSALTEYHIELHLNCYWNFNILDIEGVDYADYLMNGDEKHVAVYVNKAQYKTFQNHDSTGYKTSGRAVFVRNHPMYLDENGEYYYDEANGRIYVYSTESPASWEIRYPTLDRMFIIKDVSRVNFVDLKLTATDDYALTQNGYTGGMGGMKGGTNSNLKGGSFPDRCAIYVDNGAELTFKDCAFYNLPCEAIHAEGWITDMKVEGCSFETIGGVAVRVGAHKAPVSDLTGGSWFEGINGARDLEIVNNYFHTTGIVMPLAPILVTKAENLLISQNTISDCTSAGISVGWDFDYVYDLFDFANRTNSRNVEISYNYIIDWMTECYDQGAIYLPQQNSYVDDKNFYMNSVHHNVIIFSEKSCDGIGGLTMGIYFDISASNWHCYENVIAEQSYGASRIETDYDRYDLTEEEAKLKQLRRSNSKYIYLQHIDTQEAHNILVEKNYILNVRNTDPKAQHTEVYNEYFTVKNAVEGRNLIERDTVYIVGVGRIPLTVEEIVETAGAQGHTGDVTIFYDNNY